MARFLRDLAQADDVGHLGQIQDKHVVSQARIPREDDHAHLGDAGHPSGFGRQALQVQRIVHQSSHQERVFGHRHEVQG